jgi:hypothetical protein
MTVDMVDVPQPVSAFSSSGRLPNPQLLFLSPSLSGELFSIRKAEQK